MRKHATALTIILGLTLGFATLSNAQQPAPPTGAAPAWGKMKPHHKGLVEMRVLRQLNLSDQQRQQIRNIMQNYHTATKAQRDELRQLQEQRRTSGTLSAEQQARVEQLRAALDASAQQMRAEILNVLTPEQRAQYEQLQQQAKAKRESWRNRQQATP
ncbi:MAG: hypothetical protein C4334_12980 [Pyrinomonas sp.]|uniref:Spy/CpxP family protein refolding chaperone n=1 Tax=Pyrinomonas sp. TaxID=2080306 RepID=UPI00332BF077